MSKHNRLAYGWRYYLFGKVPLPKTMVIDPANVCNLRCPLCPAGCGKMAYPRCVMSLESFEIIVDKVPFVEHISLFNWGEPFLNPAIFGMIQYAKMKGKTVGVHTNLSFKTSEHFFSDLVNSRLDYLTVSLDGASQETYSTYRVGGDIHMVFRNIRELVKEKERMKKANPAIIWKYIVNKHNEHELDVARTLAQDMGVDFEVSKMGLSDDLPDVVFDEDLPVRMKRWLPSCADLRHEFYKGEYRTPLSDGCCTQLFSTLVVNPDGGVFPCCWLTNAENVFGNLLREPFERIWNNRFYQYSRSLFMARLLRPRKVKTICLSCRNYKTL